VKAPSLTRILLVSLLLVCGSQAMVLEESSKKPQRELERETQRERELALERELRELRQLRQREAQADVLASTLVAPVIPEPPSTSAVPLSKPSLLKRHYLIAVATLERNNLTETNAVIAAQTIRRALWDATTKTVMGRKAMRQVLAEHRVPRTGCASEECAETIGKTLRVNHLIFGSIEQVNGMYFVNLFMMNVEIEEVGYAGSAKGATMDQLQGSIKNLVSRISRKF